MLRYVFFLLNFTLVFGVNAQTAQELNPVQIRGRQSLLNSPPQYSSNTSLFATTCIPDTIRYGDSKSTGYRVIMLNSLSSTNAAAQYFDCPQSLTLSGTSFYAYKTDASGGVNITVNVRVYAAGVDSLPTGPVLANSALSIDTNFYGGNLAMLEKQISFLNPIILNQPYVIVIDNNSPVTIGIVSTDFSVNDGNGEWLNNCQYAGNWYRGYEILVSGYPLNSDFLIEPYISYNLNTDFSLNPTCISIPSTVGFTSNSSAILNSRMYNTRWFNQGYNSRSWDFGDGSLLAYGSTQNHFYAMGFYDATLTDSIFGWTRTCTDSRTKTVYGGTSTATFGQNSTNLTVNFNATGAGAVNWAWDFGDGTTGTGQNPAHTYSTPGSYNACLTTTNPCGTDVSCQTVVVNCGAPVAGFTIFQNGYNISFSNSTSGGTSFIWTFGDGSSDNLPNPMHTYASGGNYNVCLIANSICGSDTICQSFTITCPQPVAGFTSAPNLLNYQFTDATVGTSLSSWQWDFGDATNSTQQNPAHVYANPGTYTVCLTVIDACGYHYVCNQLTAVCPVPVSDFSHIDSALQVTFVDLSSDATSWSWDFGDGGSSSLQHPMHTFNSQGAYNVCQTATNSCGPHVYCTPVVVSSVGLETEKGNNPIKVYPNPAADRVFLTWSDSPFSWIIRDVSGRSLMQGFSETETTAVNIEGLAKGMYLIETFRKNEAGWRIQRLVKE